MSTPKSLFSNAWNDASEESEEDVSYSRLCILAVVALFPGIASFLVFFSVWFAFLGVLGIILALVAILSIRRSEGTLTGLGFAQSALALSLTSFIAVLLFWPMYHYGIQREADQFFRIWFTALKNDDIPLAKGLSLPYWSRPGTENPEKWWTEHYENRFAHRDLHHYTDNQLVRTLIALGNKAQISFYKTLTVATEDDKDTVVNLYAVTYPVAHGKETFFVKMVGERKFPTGDVKSAGWSLTKLPELTVPTEWKEKTQTSETAEHD